MDDSHAKNMITSSLDSKDINDYMTSVCKADDNVASNIEIMNDYITSDSFDLDNYQIAEEEVEMSTYINMMNIFMVYFREMFKKNPNLNMFEGVDYNKSDSTNRQMELFYEHLWKYKQDSDNDDKVSIYSLKNININDCKELYSMRVTKKLVTEEVCCQYLIPLLSLLSKQNWRNIDWSILPLKRDN
jgi:hypothetical protein